GDDEIFLKNTIHEQVERLTEIIDDIIVGFDEGETIEVALGKGLTEKRMTVAVAESCTGGKIAEIITSVPGSSAYFRGGLVAYATDIKTSMLGVSESLIKKHSVVSREVAEAMASRIKKMMKTDFSVATTGNAGPLKGDAEASLGTVCIAVATPDRLFSETFNFGQPRSKVIERATNKGLEMLLKEILKNY
ncbi:MAG TPA: CinA family protein, partial [Flavobacterium sp.]|nr:CinA family protein [Flavobacterium sp.]